MTLDSQIEAILFFKAEPVSVGKLAKILSCDEESVRQALIQLENKLSGGGVALIRKDDEVMLATGAPASELIAKITKDELSREIGRAGLETLSIVLYRSPISRRDIDYIRGVNSTFILRSLMVRGLVERVENPNDERVFLYRPTFELFSYLGVKNKEELPEYEAVRKEFDESEKTIMGEEKDIQNND